MNKLLVASALLAQLALAGCNTFAGLGKDLQTVGGVVTGTAEGVQRGATPANQAAPPPPGSTTPANCQPDANGLVLEGCPAPK